MEDGAIQSLPTELLVDILAIVAADSFQDFFNAKISCKIFNQVAEDDYIYKHISLDNMRRISWLRPEEGEEFMQRCINCDNLEALYRQGLHECISSMRAERGMELLKRAACMGHLGASYLFGLLLVCKGGEATGEGIRLLKKVYASGKVVECRRKYVEASCEMWWKNRSILGGEPRYECQMQKEHRKRRGWERDIDHYDDTECDACICQAETAILYRYCRPVP